MTVPSEWATKETLPWSLLNEGCFSQNLLYRRFTSELRELRISILNSGLV